MIGNILKNMRLSANLTQKDLAEKLNLADNTISSYERENSQADFDTILNIAKICGYTFKIIDNNNNLLNIEDLSKEMDF